MLGCPVKQGPRLFPSTQVELKSWQCVPSSIPRKTWLEAVRYERDRFSMGGCTRSRWLVKSDMRNWQAQVFLEKTVVDSDMGVCVACVF